MTKSFLKIKAAQRGAFLFQTIEKKMSPATIVNSRLLPPYASVLLRNQITTRSLSSLPPEPSTLGGLITVIAERLGIGE